MTTDLQVFLQTGQAFGKFTGSTTITASATDPKSALDIIREAVVQSAAITPDDVRIEPEAQANSGSDHPNEWEFDTASQTFTITLIGKANNVNYNLGGTVEFQLQESDDGTTYTDVAGATASATGTGQQTVTFDDISKTVGAEVEDQFYYRVKVTDTETDQEVVSSDRTTGFTVGPAVVKYETDYTAPTVSGETMTRERKCWSERN